MRDHQLQAPSIDTAVVLIKRLLLKNKRNQSIFREITGLNLPHWPVITRW